MAMIAGQDLDLDGIEDVVVGGTILPGGAWGVVACSGLSGQPLWSTPAPSAQSRFGTQLAWLDDLDGDGSAEVAVGAPDAYLSGVPPLPGSVQVLSGADGSARSALVGAVPEFGRTLAAPGDLDGDGSIDLLVTDGSKTDLYSGTTGRILASFFPPAHYLSGVGDLDGDGRGEWVSRGWSGWTSVYGWR